MMQQVCCPCSFYVLADAYKRGETVLVMAMEQQQQQQQQFTTSGTLVLGCCCVIFKDVNLRLGQVRLHVCSVLQHATASWSVFSSPSHMHLCIYTYFGVAACWLCL
jgi:hypothetical protein